VGAKRSHLAASRALQAGSTLDVGEFVTVESDWSSLPDDVVTEPDQVLGRTLVRSIAAGTPLSLNLLRQTSVIKTGERVRVQMSGSNFVVSGEGQALQAGAIGEQVRIKMANGQAVSATVLRQGVVEVRID
jgi:flagella basal body P-ring formation protein FlgA